MKSWWESWWAAVVTLFGVLLAGVSQAISRVTHGNAQAAWIVAAVVGSLTAATAPIIDRRRRESQANSHEDDLIRVREEQTVALNDALDPLAERLAIIVSKPREQRKQEAGALVSQALACAASIFGRDRTRACYFEADGLSDPPRVKPVAFAGRSGKPRSVFRAGTPEGNFVIGMLERDETYFCVDVETEPPPGWDPGRPRGYRTFLAVPARAADGEAVGMITVDAPTPGDLRGSDAALLRVFGTILAVGIKIAEGLDDQEEQE